MSLLSSQDLLVVYKPEKGNPTSFSVDGVDFSALDNTFGEVYSVECVAENIVVIDGEETDQVSNGNGLLVSVKIRSGTVTEVFVEYGGENYTENEVLTIGDGNARISVTEVGAGGTVNDVTLYLDEGGTDYVITDGLLTDFPYGYHDDMMNYEPATVGSFVDFKVTSGQVTSAIIGTQKFTPLVSTDNKTFTVGEEVHVLSSRFSDGTHIPIKVLTVTNVESGGICKFTSDQLKQDVQEWADEVDINLSIEVRDNDGTSPIGGDITYDIQSGKLTFTRSNIDVRSDEEHINLDGEYGFVIDNSGNVTDNDIDTQAELNQQLFMRIRKLEQHLYRDLGDGSVAFDFPQLANGTLAKDSEGDTYSEIATRNDLDAYTQSVTDATDAISQVNELQQLIADSADFAALQSAITPPPDSGE